MSGGKLVDYVQAQLRSLTRNYLAHIQSSGQSGTLTQDHRISSPAAKPLGNAASKSRF